MKEHVDICIMLMQIDKEFELSETQKLRMERIVQNNMMSFNSTFGYLQAMGSNHMMYDMFSFITEYKTENLWWDGFTADGKWK